MQFEKWSSVDLLRPLGFVPDLGFPVFAGDDNAVRIGVNLYKGKTAETVTGTVKGYCILPNGVMVAPWTGGSDGNKAWIDLPADALVLPGRIQIAIRLDDTNEDTVIFAASATVRRIDSDTLYDPDDVVPMWGDILDKIAEMDQAAQACEDAAEDATAAAAAGVRTDTDAQGLTETQKANARTNIGALDSSAMDEIAPEVIGKNLYDKDTMGPEDKYYYNLTTGVKSAADAYAVTGLIPVEAETQYIFSAGGVRVKHVAYFSGAEGGTFISSETVNDLAFTTPASCTFIGINLFAATHTTAQFNTAIAAGQLEKGAAATPYEPYTKTRMVTTDHIEGGDSLEAVGEITETASPVNLYDKSLAVNGKYYYTNGSVQTSADYAITGLIPVKPNTQYCISRDPDSPLVMGGAVLLYGENQSFISTATLGGYIYNTLYAFTTTAATHFIGVNLYKVGHTAQEFSDTVDTLMLCCGTQRPDYAAYAPEALLKAGKLTDAYFRNDGAFTGKKWLATGTSITWYDSKAYQAGVHEGELCRGYVGNVARRKALSVTNEGINGSTLGDVNANSLINRYQSLNWAGTDIATIEYGVNDFGNNVPVGTAEDAAGTTTFAACLKTVIEYALAQNPHICLVICTEPDVRGTNTNNNGNTLKDYTDVTLAIAAQYRLPVCDWYYHSGISAVTKGDQSKDWLTCDGTHPNDQGHNRMGAMLNKVFDGLIC